MMRGFLHIVLPLLLPVLLYLLWVVVTRRHPLPGWWREAPWPWIGATSGLLLIVSLVLWAELGGAPPGEVYVPPRFEDGRVVPGRTTPQ